MPFKTGAPSAIFATRNYLFIQGSLPAHQVNLAVRLKLERYDGTF